MSQTITETTRSDAEQATVDAALDALLAAHDPRASSFEAFREARYDAGLAWVHFDEGHGGLGVRPGLNAHVERRLRAAGAAPERGTQFFMHLAGPTIHTFGTDEQKQRFLRPMFAGRELWCQLFSEPGAGSDLAGLATRAVRDGDEWVVNGQKVWNTLAHLGHWGMLVTRTDPEAPKHKGLTYFAVDMHSPGVEVRPLRQITGEAEFNEVYLTDARIPDANRLGPVGEGWRVSLTTLMNERTAIAGSDEPRRTGIDDAIDIWRSLPAERRSAADRDRIMQLWCKFKAIGYTNVRAAQRRTAGNPGPEGSVGKLAFADLNKAVFELCVDLLGMDGQVGYDYTFRRPDDLSVGGGMHGVRYAFLRARANSIEGGTSEIMKNILGEQVLGLPGEPRVDKDIPWSKVPR